MASAGQFRAAVEAQVAGVGAAADAGALAALYAPDGRLYDRAGGQPVIQQWLEKNQRITLISRRRQARG